MNPRTLSRTAIGLLLAAAPGLALAAGSVMFVAGDVRVVGPDGTARTAVKGMPVKPGDRIVTPSGASAQVKMDDGAVVAVRPASQILFEPPGPNDTRQLTLVSGAVRVAAVDTGPGDKAGYEIKTPNALFKVHKSDQETLFVRPDAPEAADGSQAGTFQKVHYGKGEMKTGDKTVALERRDIGFVPMNAKGATATKLDRLPAAVEKAYGNPLLTKLDAGRIGTPAGAPGKPGLSTQKPAPLAIIAPIKAGAAALPVSMSMRAGAPPSANVRPPVSSTQPISMGSIRGLAAPVAAIARPPTASQPLQPALTLKPAAPSGTTATPGTAEFQIVGNKPKAVAATPPIIVPNRRSK